MLRLTCGGLEGGAAQRVLVAVQRLHQDGVNGVGSQRGDRAHHRVGTEEGVDSRAARGVLGRNGDLVRDRSRIMRPADGHTLRCRCEDRCRDFCGERRDW